MGESARGRARKLLAQAQELYVFADRGTYLHRLSRLLHACDARSSVEEPGTSTRRSAPAPGIGGGIAEGPEDAGKFHRFVSTLAERKFEGVQRHRIGPL